MTVNLAELKVIDDQLSHRHIDLDPAGYFVIYIDRDAHLICAKHYTNNIDANGLATDPETGKPIPAKGKVERTATQIYTGRTAKELCVKIWETSPQIVSLFDHAAYLGREFMRAEIALINGDEYIQD